MYIINSCIDDINTVTDDTISEVIESRIAVCDKNILIYKEYDNVNSYNNIYQESGDSILTKIKNGLKHIWEKIVLVFNQFQIRYKVCLAKPKEKQVMVLMRLPIRLLVKTKSMKRLLLD